MPFLTQHGVDINRRRGTRKSSNLAALYITPRGPETTQAERGSKTPRNLVAISPSTSMETNEPAVDYNPLHVRILHCDTSRMYCSGNPQRRLTRAAELGPGHFMIQNVSYRHLEKVDLRFSLLSRVSKRQRANCQ